ncbi:MAG TPA: pilus assembly protein TadG-related protein, partial [Rhodoblastus sp.]|nr:pilus assembly protein TadG-related protein [Rhodoblastus sp.]
MRDADGTLGIIFSLTLVPIVLLMSATIDYSSNNAMRQRVQDALDAAVLAGASSSNPTTTSSQRISTAQQTFNSSIGPDARFVTGVSFTVDATTAKVTGNATTERTSL